MEKFKALIEVKKLIALILTLVFAFLSIKGTIEAGQFITVFSVIVSFYFGQSSARSAIQESKNS